MRKPTFTGIVGSLEVGGGDFGPFKENFSFFATGYLFLEKDDNVVLQLTSDDGSRLFLDGNTTDRQRRPPRHGYRKKPR